MTEYTLSRRNEMTSTSPVRATREHSRLSLSTSEPPPSVIPPEIEATLSRLSAYRNVRGVMVLSRGAGGGIVQCTGNVFEGESGRIYAKSLQGVVAVVGTAVSDCDEGVS
jgi:hypothetical protein